MEPRSVHELFGQPVASSGRDRLVAIGIELFYRNGFQAIGIDNVIAEAGVSKTTFYKHFDSKDDFVLACIQTRDAWEMGAWDRAANQLAGDDPRAQLIAFFDVLDLWFNDDGFRGCYFINAASEFSDRRDPIHKAAALHKRKNRDHFLALAQKAGATDPEVFADLYTVILEGTLVLRHVHDRDDAARIMKPRVMEIIDQWIPAKQ